MPLNSFVLTTKTDDDAFDTILFRTQIADEISKYLYIN